MNSLPGQDDHQHQDDRHRQDHRRGADEVGESPSIEDDRRDGSGEGDVPSGARERLVCGASTDDLLSQVAEGRGAVRDAHQRDCLHCQATLGEYLRLWDPMRELADVEVHAPPDLLSRTLRGLRAHTTPDGQGHVEDRGEQYHVAARAVVTVAGHVARATEGVRVALSGLGALTTPPSGLAGPAQPVTSDGAAARANSGRVARVGIQGQSVAVELTVAADYGQDLHRLADRLRVRVADAVLGQLGMDAVQIAVEITDVFPPRPDR